MHDCLHNYMYFHVQLQNLKRQMMQFRSDALVSFLLVYQQNS